MKAWKKITIAAGSIALVSGIGLGVGNAFVAPGLHVNGVEIGMATHGSALGKMEDLLSNGSVSINGAEFTYGELGVKYDEEKLKGLLKENKAISFDSWNSTISQSIIIDEEMMKKSVSEKLPDAYADPVDANVQLNENGENWEIVAGKNGTMPKVEELRAAIEKDLTSENRTDEVKSYELSQEEITPKITNSVAEEFVNDLNTMADEAGFYEGEELKVEIPKSDFNELITVEQTDDGFALKPVEDSLRNYAETVPEKVNKEVDNGKAVVDENGKVLKTLDEWQDGYKFDDVEGLVSRSVEQLNNGESKFALNGEITEAKIDERFRRVEVDLDARETRTYENDELVKTYKVAIGKPSTPTDKGHFKVFHQTKMMDMGCTPAYDYCTKDVPFATFYNGGEAFHGTWWHSDFGNPNASARSHGCVNMTRGDAEEIYYFAQTGTPVHVF